MSRASALPPSLAPKYIGREAAAEFLGVRPSKFDQLVRDGRVPRPRRWDRRIVWEVGALQAVEADGDDAPADTTWDD